MIRLKKTAKKSIPYYFILPILLIAGLVPLIVYLKVIPLDEITFQFWTGEKDNTDFFSYYKALLTIVFSASALLVLAYAWHKGILEVKKLLVYYLPMGAYALFIILSAAFSKYPHTAVMGFADRYEGVFVLLAYLLILFITMNLVNDLQLIKITITVLCISAFIVGTIGIFQFFGIDFFNSDIGKAIILPAAYKNLNLTFNFGKYTIYSTLYNTNFVGSYMAILFPLSLAVFVYVKKPYLKILTAILTCLMFANLIGCRSRAGYMGGVVAFVLLIVLLRKQIIRNIRIVLPLFLSFILIFIGMDSFAGGGLSNRVRATLQKDYNASQKVQKEQIKDILVNGDKATVVCKPDSLTLEFAENQVNFLDTRGEALTVFNDGAGNITFKDSRYAAFKIYFDPKYNLFEVDINKMALNFLLKQDGFKIVGERNTLVDKIDHPETFGFRGNELFASSRGYIWSRSIPLLKNNIIIGGGPDTYAMQFPQHDYVGKLIAFGKVNEIVDKPHNMYLQIGINTGVLSLIAVLLLFCIYLVSSFRLYAIRKIPTDTAIIGIALFCAVIGYLIAGLANDSLVSVAPVFWVVLGLGISCNYMIEKGIKTPVAAVATSTKSISGKIKR